MELLNKCLSAGLLGPDELEGNARLFTGVPRPRDGFFLRAESFFNVATEIEIEKLDAEPGAGPPIGPSYGERPLHEQSHGESFLALLVNRFHGEGLYLLDEPEAALSPIRQLSVITRMHDLVQEKSQFIIATHSPLLMAYPHACIYAFSPKGIERVLTRRRSNIESRATFSPIHNGCYECCLHHDFKWPNWGCRAERRVHPRPSESDCTAANRPLGVGWRGWLDVFMSMLAAAINHWNILKPKAQRRSTPGEPNSDINVRGVDVKPREREILENHRFSILQCWFAQFTLPWKFSESHRRARKLTPEINGLAANCQSNSIVAAETQVRKGTVSRNFHPIRHDKG